MSTRQTLKDNAHRTIGYINTEADGRQTVMDPSHRVLGYYDPKKNITLDHKHTTLGYGNLLATLLR